MQFHPSKTPGRMKGRGENAVRGPMTAQAKGKEAAARTPFHPTTLRESTNILIYETSMNISQILRNCSRMDRLHNRN